MEFPNGDEVATTLVYERLDKHCTKCLKLDHELKDCLVARAERKALEANQQQAQASGLNNHDAGHGRVASSVANKHEQRVQAREPRNEVFHFSASNPRNDFKHKERVSSERMSDRNNKSQPQRWQERSYQRRSSQASERSRHEYERSAYSRRDWDRNRTKQAPPGKNFYREVSRRSPDVRDDGSSVAKSNHEAPDKGNPQDPERHNLPLEAVNEVLGEVRNTILQYTMSADPAEREARQERVRRAEELGEVQENAERIVRNSLNSNLDQPTGQVSPTPERLPASQRLGSSPHNNPRISERSQANRTDNPQEGSNERIPAAQRLGPSQVIEDGRAEAALASGAKRKPGRPPGSKASGKPKPPANSAPKNRRVTKAKGTPPRRKTPLSPAPNAKTKSKGGTSRGGAEATSTTSSDNRPICNMIPAISRRRMDFRTPSLPAP